jgi:hypothetical protein
MLSSTIVGLDYTATRCVAVIALLAAAGNAMSGNAMTAMTDDAKFHGLRARACFHATWPCGTFMVAVLVVNHAWRASSFKVYCCHNLFSK